MKYSETNDFLSWDEGESSFSNGESTMSISDSTFLLHLSSL